MALTTSQLSVGKRVRTPGFNATVTLDGRFDDDGNPTTQTYKGEGTKVRVKDSNGNTHFIDLAKLEVEIPFTDGGLYLSNNGTFVYYVASPDGKPGTWRVRQTDGERGTVSRSFNYPARPLTPISFGEAITE